MKYTKIRLVKDVTIYDEAGNSLMNYKKGAKMYCTGICEGGYIVALGVITFEEAVACE